MAATPAPASAAVLGLGPGLDADLAAWLRLAQTPGVGPVAARALLSRFGLPGNIFAASAAVLATVVPPAVVRALSAPPPGWPAQLARTAAWLALPGNAIVTLADGAYPPLLLEIHDPPLLIHVKGDVGLLARPALAIVGSRNASTQGLLNAEAFARALGGAGLTIVSGLALGIDSAAHQGALASAGSTIAVIGTGIDIVYPRRNLALARRIAAGGCIVSEYALGTPAMAGNFPRRNRIISGLSRGVLVVEAAAQSGSLITARLAAEQGRDVFAIPGSIHAALAKGCHLLIKQGARLVESSDDVLQELGWPAAVNAVSAAAPPLIAFDAGQHAALLAALGHDPVDADTLATRSGQPAASVLQQLLELELLGHVEKLPGALFQRCHR